MFKVVEARGFDINVIADLLMHFGRVLQLKKKNTHTHKEKFDAFIPKKSINFVSTFYLVSLIFYDTAN